MFNPEFYYQQTQLRKGSIFIPVINSSVFTVRLQTRSGRAFVKKGDGSAPIPFNSKVNNANIVLNYASAFTGTIEVILNKGAQDIDYVSLQKYSSAEQRDNSNILDIETFFAQFTKLKGVLFQQYTYGQGVSGSSDIRGDVSRLPISVENVNISDFQMAYPSLFTVNFSNYSLKSNLKSFGVYYSGSMPFLGDFAKLPVSCAFFNIHKLTNIHALSNVTYSGGKVWASNFDTLKLYFKLTKVENDLLLNDMANSVTTAVGGKTIFFYNSQRSSASDSAVAYLIGLGFTITGITKV